MKALLLPPFPLRKCPNPSVGKSSEAWKMVCSTRWARPGDEVGIHQTIVKKRISLLSPPTSPPGQVFYLLCTFMLYLFTFAVFFCIFTDYSDFENKNPFYLYNIQYNVGWIIKYLQHVVNILQFPYSIHVGRRTPGTTDGDPWITNKHVLISLLLWLLFLYYGVFIT